MKKVPHIHNWEEVAGWDLDQIAEHWAAQHNNSGSKLPILTVDDVRQMFWKVEPALEMHKQMHLTRRDGTAPPAGQLPEWLRDEALRQEAA